MTTQRRYHTEVELAHIMIPFFPRMLGKGLETCILRSHILRQWLIFYRLKMLKYGEEIKKKCTNLVSILRLVKLFTRTFTALLIMTSF